MSLNTEVSSTAGNERLAEFMAGVRGQLPILLGVVPFGIIFGVVSVTVGIPPLFVQGFSLLIFAGSAQFIAAGLVGASASPIVIVVTIFAVNLRHVLYSATMAPYWAKLKAYWKASLAWLLTDEAFVVAVVRYRSNDNHTHAHWFMLGTGLTLWTSWQISTALGIVLGENVQVPESLGLEFVIPLTFMAIMFPMLTDRPSVAAALVAGLAAVALDNLPFKSGLLLAALIGIAVGMALEALRPNWVTSEEDGQ